MNVRSSIVGPLAVLFILAINPAPAQTPKPATTPATAQAPKPAAAPAPQTADAEARKQLAAYLADYRNDPANTDLRDKIIDLAKTLKPAPAVPLSARVRYATAIAQLDHASTPENFKTAAENFEQVAAEAPWWAEAWLNAAKAYAKAADLANARKDLEIFKKAQRPDAESKDADSLQSDIDLQQAEVDRKNAEIERQKREEEGKQALEEFQKALADFNATPNDANREQVIKLASKLQQPPEIPEDATRHFVRANAFEKAAKTDADYDQVVSEFNQAIQIAPWWGDAYYNLAIAMEARGRFDEATRLIGLYLMSGPGEKDAREAKNRLYAIEAEKDMAKKHEEEVQTATAARHANDQWQQLNAGLAQEERRLALQGPWECNSGCDNAHLDVSDGGFSGNLIFSWKDPGWSEIVNGVENTQSLHVGYYGKFSGLAVSEGQASFPNFKRGPCVTRPDSQEITGSISQDGRTLWLKTAMTMWNVRWQPGLLVSTCLEISSSGTTPVDVELVSKAPPPIPLLLVVQGGHIENVQMVLDHGANIGSTDPGGQTALHLAARGGNLEIAHLLLQKGANVNAQDKEGETPLDRAVEAHSLTLAWLFIQSGANVNLQNAHGDTPLMLSLGNSDIARVLLDHGANIEARNKDGYSALFLAADQPVGITQLLVDHHANVSATANDGSTPLHMAASKGRADIAAILLSHGASATVPDHSGATPLHRAAESGNAELVQTLISHGADVNAKDNKGHSVLKYAKESHKRDVEKLLQQMGAK
jgi:ankyrin repeat protein/tetratricopeptide (TPR) repeat protein